MHPFHVRVVTFMLAVFPAAVVFAEGPTLKPGKWEVTTVSENSMGQPKTTSQTECVKEDKDPLDVIMEAKACKVSDKKIDGYTVSWKMECGEFPAGKGKGTFTADGTTGEGVLEMDFAVKGQEIHVKNTWKGKRVGDCD